MIDMMLGRRRLIGGALAVGGASLLPGAAFAAGAERRLAFHNVHTNERFDARYFGARGWDPQGLAEIDHGMRDWRTGESMAIDRDLLVLLTGIRDRVGVAPGKAFDLISGYRSPNTNGALRSRGGAHTGVATRSQHMLGKAVDIAIPGVPIDRLKLAAVSARRGGVGAYPKDGFVHVDTGRVRYW